MTRSQGPGTSCNQVLDITPCQISTTKKQDIPLKPRVPEAWKLKEPIEIGKNEFMKVESRNDFHLMKIDMNFQTNLQGLELNLFLRPEVKIK